MLDSLYLEYSFLGLTKEEFYNLIKDKNTIESIKECINNYIKNILKNNKSILLKYIDTLNNKDLDKLTSFFTSLDLEIEDYIYILKNNTKVYSLIEKLYKEDKDLNNICINNFICAYKLINNIDIVLDIENDDNNYIEDFYTEDTYGQFLYYIRKYKVLTDEEVKELYNRISKNDIEARNTLILHNLRLVNYVANKSKFYHLDILDLIQAGVLGLIKAIEMFDYTKRYRFSTYAYYWIRQYIEKEISHYKNGIKIPVKVDIKLSEFKKRKSELEQKLGRHLTNQELSTMLDIKLSVIEKLERLDSTFVSLNTKIFDDSDEEINDQLISSTNVEEEVISKSLSTDILTAFKMANLSENEIYVLTKRYYEDNMSYKKIAKLMGITPQRVQQIEVNALSKLKKPEIIKMLSVYYNNGEESKEQLTIKLKSNFLEYFDGNFFKVLYLIETLNEDEIHLIYKLYDKNTLNLRVVKNETDISFIDLVNKIKNRLPKNIEKPINNLFTYFSEFSKEEVIKTIKTLSISDKNILFSFYNKDYSLVKKLSDNDIRSIKTILDKVKKQLLKDKMTFITNARNLMKYLNITKEEILDIIKENSEYKVIMDFYNEEFTNYKVINDNNYILFYNTLKRLSELIIEMNNIYTYKNLTAKLGVSSKVLKEKISLLKVKYRRIIAKVYKDDLTNGDVSSLNKNEKALFKEALSELRKQIKDIPKIKVNIENYDNLLDYFNIDKFTLERSLSFLEKEKLIYLKNIYNEDFTKIVKDNIDVFILEEIIKELEMILTKVIYKESSLLKLKRN